MKEEVLEAGKRTVVFLWHLGISNCVTVSIIKPYQLILSLIHHIFYIN